MTAFLHIGLGKCASTSIQTLWANSENYNYGSLNKLATHIATLIRDNKNDLDSAVGAIQSINLEPPKFESKKVNVLSSEAVTFSFIEDFQNGHLTQLKQQAMAVLLKGLCSKVLMLIRNPIEWIVSAHAQHVKQGGSASLEEFLVGAEETIYHNLNLNFIKSVFEEQGFEVVILPIELMKSSEEAFWKVYTDKLGAAKPTFVNFPKDKRSANITNRESIPVHTQLNKILEEISMLVEKSSAYSGVEGSKILESLEHSKRWGTRAALHELSKTELENLKRLLNIDTPALNSGFTIDTVLKTHLQNNFIEPLCDEDVFPFSDILTTYKAAVGS